MNKLIANLIAAKEAGEGYLIIELNGQEAWIGLSKVTLAWLERADEHDIERIAVY